MLPGEQSVQPKRQHEACTMTTCLIISSSSTMFRIWRSIYYKILLIVVRCSQGDQVGSAVVAVDGGAWHDYQPHVLCHEKKRGRTLMKPAPLAISSAVSAPRTGTLKLSSTPFHRESWYSSPMQPPTAAADDSKMAPLRPSCLPKIIHSTAVDAAHPARINAIAPSKVFFPAPGTLVVPHRRPTIPAAGSPKPRTTSPAYAAGR
mmetsp:Transcript_46273/g.115744  ORF Transcript_46273/g.115744 Transcript_46273/m.115744 type:complete len:204 (-) Transcript_46273:901-1512(-)